jgi:hypothetical protein
MAAAAAVPAAETAACAQEPEPAAMRASVSSARTAHAASCAAQSIRRPPRADRCPPGGQSQHQPGDRHVDQEDGPPAGRVDQGAADDRAGGDGGAADRRPGRDRAGAAGSVRIEPRDHRHGRGHARGPGGAEYDAERDQHPERGGHGRQQRAQTEHRGPRAEDQVRAVTVGDRPGRQEQ